MIEKKLFGLPVILLVLMSLIGSGVTVDAQKKWSRRVDVAYYPSSADNTIQPALVHAPRKSEKRPLLVALHTWSNDFTQVGDQAKFGDWCIQNDWYMIHPNFRGKNKTPESTGSDLAVADIVSAVDYMKSKYNIDEDRVYLSGTSGGGHMSLLMAGRHPEIWAGVSAWCGISDIQVWWEQKTADGPKRYAEEIEKAIGGKPDTDTQAALECRKRSPLTYLENAASVNLDINHGIHDGRRGSVPFTHSLHAYNKVVPSADELSEEDIEAFYATQKVPAHLQSVTSDPVYGDHPPIFRRQTTTCRITIFEGGHEILRETALNWLNLQTRGKPAVWTVESPIKLR